jgi:DNA-binding SARP family transcriptional activator
VDDLWGGAPPEDAANALQALVSRLRRAIGAALVVTDARGYRLQVPSDAVDVGRFDALVAEGSLDRVREALALWRGPALADVAELPFAEAAAARLADRRASAAERAAELGLDRGDAAAEIDRLTAQLDAAPLRETTAALLARCLHAAGRQADALAVLDRTRALLVEQLGVDPGAEWAAARLAVLRDERPVAPARPVQLPLTSFVGRDRDVDRLRGLLPGTRLMTLTGPGGAGKTRLAVQLAAEFGGRVAELAGLTAPEQLPAALLMAVGSPEVALRMQTSRAPTCCRGWSGRSPAARCCSCWTTASTSSRTWPGSSRCCWPRPRACACSPPAGSRWVCRVRCCIPWQRWPTTTPCGCSPTGPALRPPASH